MKRIFVNDNEYRVPEAVAAYMVEMADLITDLRADVSRLRTIIEAAAAELSPDCPDTSAYTDGSCSLEDTARAVMAELDNLKRAPMCEYPGCPKRAELECVLPASHDDECATTHPLCLVHAEAEGYCVGCGQFWSGIEDFDRDPSGLCPNCRDQMVDDDENAEDDEIPF